MDLGRFGRCHEDQRCAHCTALVYTCMAILCYVLRIFERRTAQEHTTHLDAHTHTVSDGGPLASPSPLLGGRCTTGEVCVGVWGEGGGVMC